ncbi:MAG: putative membrane protein YfcA [Planctomycetota bacterium]
MQSGLSFRFSGLNLLIIVPVAAIYSFALILISLVVGLLIGAVGVGGVLLVPALTYLGQISVHQAIPACMLSFLFSGVIATMVFAYHGSIHWKMVGWLTAGAIPAAFLGSVLLLSIPASFVLSLIAVLMIFSGIDAMWKSSRFYSKPEHRRAPGRVALIVIGIVTGFGSSITGTGGPLILVPVMVFLGFPVLAAIGLSQAIQIPIASFASIGNWMEGTLDVELGLVITAAMVAGTLAGSVLIHRLPEKPVRRFVALLLVGVGVGIAINLLRSL